MIDLSSYTGRNVRATEPEDVTRLITGRLNAGDAAGVAALCELQAVLASPPTSQRPGVTPSRPIYQQMADTG
jgi:hypothetical protein